MYDTEVYEPITTHRLLFGRNLLYFGKSSTISENDDSQEAVSQRNKHTKNVLLNFSNRFKCEYYTALRELSQRRVDMDTLKLVRVMLF